MLDGAVDPLALDAESFFVASADGAAESFFVAPADEEALEESFFDMSTDAEPDGLLGVVEPADEDGEPGVVVRETALSPSLSQPVSIPAPSARDTATAKAENFICGPPWVGVRLKEQGLGLSL